MVILINITTIQIHIFYIYWPLKFIFANHFGSHQSNNTNLVFDHDFDYYDSRAKTFRNDFNICVCVLFHMLLGGSWSWFARNARRVIARLSIRTYIYIYMCEIAARVTARGVFFVICYLHYITHASIYICWLTAMPPGNNAHHPYSKAYHFVVQKSTLKQNIIQSFMHTNVGLCARDNC